MDAFHLIANITFVVVYPDIDKIFTLDTSMFEPKIYSALFNSWIWHPMLTLIVPYNSFLLFGVIVAIVREDTREYQRSSGKFSLRAPVPRTLNKLTELDQAFALGLAVISFLYSRRQTVAWISKDISLGLRKFTERAHRCFTEREINPAPRVHQTPPPVLLRYLPPAKVPRQPCDGHCLANPPHRHP